MTFATDDSPPASIRFARPKQYPCTECNRRLRANAQRESRNYDAAKAPAVVSAQVMLSAPGMCDGCKYDLRNDEAAQRLSGAVASIHGKRRWARFDSGLMAQRIKPFSWTLHINGNAVLNDDGMGYNGALVPQLLASLEGATSLVISGAMSGLGKTSIAVAIMRRFLDAAREEMAHGREPDARAEDARMVAEIDLADKDPARAHMAYSRAMRAPWLLLDDVGQLARDEGFKSKEFCATVRNILDTRERSGRKFTLITTWGGGDLWSEWFDGRTKRLYWDEPGSVVLEMRAE